MFVWQEEKRKTKRKRRKAKKKMQSEKEILEAIYYVDNLLSNAEENEEKSELTKIKSYLQKMTDPEKDNKKEYKGFGLI